MSNLKVTGRGIGYTLISNVFIDNYMVTSGSSHLKTYLLLLRLWSDPQKEISVSGMADILDCSESDVLRSLRHWEKKGLMKLSYQEDNRTLSEILLLEPQNAEERMEPQQQEIVVSRAPKQPELPPRQVDMTAVSADEKFSRLMFIAEQYIGAPLSRADCESFAWLYDGLKMDVSLLEYLVEYCITNGHKSVRYMEKVAIDWHQKKIETVEQARIYTPLYNKNLYTVMKALGLSGRQPAPSEQQIINKWFQEYGFSLDMVVEACNRTMISIHEPNLNYVESILNRWKKAGISRLDQVQGMDEKFQKTVEKKAVGADGGGDRDSKKKNKSYPSGKKPGAQFHDFQQRTYDYDELLKRINGTDHSAD